MEIDHCLQKMDYEDVLLNVWFRLQFNINSQRERERIHTHYDFRVIVEFHQTSHKNIKDTKLMEIRHGYNGTNDQI